MSKYLKGDLLVFTNKGLIRIDNLDKNNHLILSLNKEGKYYYEEIDEIIKIYKNKYVLNKISFNNNIDSYLINDNYKIKSIINIPNSIETNEISEYLNYNESRSIFNSKIDELSSFDFISFPTSFIFNNNKNENENDFNENDYKFQGLYISSDRFNNEIPNNKEIIDFIIDYLDSKYINYNIINKNDNVKIEINNNDINKIRVITLIELIELIENIKIEQLIILTKSLIEFNNKFTINNKDDYYLIKYIYLLLGVFISSYYKDGKIQIIIPKKISDSYYYYFNYNNYIHNKIRNFKKINNKGFLYSLSLKNNNFFLTDIGLIS